MAAARIGASAQLAVEGLPLDDDGLLDKANPVTPDGKLPARESDDERFGLSQQALGGVTAVGKMSQICNSVGHIQPT